MIKNNIKQCLGLLKEIFISWLTSVVVIACNHTKYVFLSNQKCKVQPTLINLHPNEYSQELHYYPFAVKLGRCVGSCNNLNDFSHKACVSNKAEVLNLSVFSMITGINESKKLTKHISCECKSKFDGRKSNSNQMWNNINDDASAKKYF